MKILHTADWHLGKRLCGKPRLDEQSEVLDEIAETAERECVDAVVVAGDIFDTSVPSAEAEELFFRACARLAAGRCFIGIAGNHDDPERLAAPSGMADALNIFLIGGRNGKAKKSGIYETGDGFVRISKGGETLTLGVLPYPQHSSLSVGENREKPYAQLVKERLGEISGNFTDGGFNVMVTHVFAAPGEGGTEMLLTDERTLGTASLLPPAVFPPCDYTALGHVHKPMTVSKSKNALYSGSILSYSFDDLSEKSVIIAEFSKKDGKNAADIKRVPLSGGKRLVKLTAACFGEALKALGDNADKHVHLIYKGDIPLTLGEMNELKKFGSFCSFENAAEQRRETVVRKERPITEQFSDFYKFVRKTDAPPPEDMVDMFLKVINGEEV